MHAFLHRNGEMTLLAAARDMDYWPSAINDLGDIVGVAIQAYGAGASDAVRYAQGTTIKLSSEVDDLGDWELLSATGINNAGIIVGTGYRTHTHTRHGFMLVPVPGQ
jgi:hypothetical protein